MNDDETGQIDFMEQVEGIRWFEGVCKRASRVQVGDAWVRLADLADIIKMKRAADRPRDRAVLEILEKSLEAITASQSTQAESPQKAK